MSELENQVEAVEEAKDPTPTGPTVIPAVNPTPEEMVSLCENIKINHDFNVDVKPVKFNFKKSKDKETGIETVRESVTLAVAYPSVEGILAILETGGKGLELLVDAVEGVINVTARDIIADDFSINASNFPIDKITWEAIANMPKAQRRGGGIPKESMGRVSLRTMWKLCLLLQVRLLNRSLIWLRFL